MPISALIKQRKHEAGLSLIEVLVATALLAMSSFLIYQVVVGSFETNRKLSSESDVYVGITIAMQALERDITHLYSPTLGEIRQPEDSTPRAFWSPPLRPDGLRRTRFLGTKEKITFIAISNRRTQAESRESDLIKVTWEIFRDRNDTYTLSRKVNTNVFDYDEEFQEPPEEGRVKILEGLTTGSFRFFRLSKEEWVDSWDSETLYIEESARFPTLVSIDFSFPSPENKNAPIRWRSEFAPAVDINQISNSSGAVNNPATTNNNPATNTSGGNTSGGR